MSGGRRLGLLCDLGEVTNLSESQFPICKMGMTGEIRDKLPMKVALFCKQAQVTCFSTEGPTRRTKASFMTHSYP